MTRDGSPRVWRFSNIAGRDGLPSLRLGPVGNPKNTKNTQGGGQGRGLGGEATLTPTRTLMCKPKRCGMARAWMFWFVTSGRPGCCV